MLNISKVLLESRFFGFLCAAPRLAIQVNLQITLYFVYYAIHIAMEFDYVCTAIINQQAGAFS